MIFGWYGCVCYLNPGKCNLLTLTSSNQVIIFPGINLASLDTSEYLCAVTTTLSTFNFTVC